MKDLWSSAHKGWIALAGYVDSMANLISICVETGKKNDLEYYLTRPRHTGDKHGQAPLLWSASALLSRIYAVGVVCPRR